MYNYSSNGKEVTFGEILVSIIFVLILIVIGILISNGISGRIAKNNEVYENAFKISKEEEDLFKYAMQTDIGNSLVYGDIEAVDMVKFSELKNEYISVKRTAEKYTQHTKIETYKDGNGNTHTRTRTYEEWDYYKSEIIDNKEVTFMKEKFNSSKFDFSPYYKKLSLDSNVVQESFGNKVKGNYLYERNKILWEIGDIRYKYEVVPVKLSGTVYVSLRENNMFPINSKVIDIHDGNIEDFLKSA